MADARALELEEFAPGDSVLRPEDSTPGQCALDPVLDVPVSVSAVLGRARLSVGRLLSLDAGSVLELDRKVGEAIDIYAGDRLLARGELVIVGERLGVTMTEIVGQDG
jgi:flagellar motor switch protein FliN/FliY